MILDTRALRDEFVPQELQHRNSEIDHISSCLRPIEEDIKGEHVLITEHHLVDRNVLRSVFECGYWHVELRDIDRMNSRTGCTRRAPPSVDKHTIVDGSGLSGLQDDILKL